MNRDFSGIQGIQNAGIYCERGGFAFLVRGMVRQALFGNSFLYVKSILSNFTTVTDMYTSINTSTKENNLPQFVTDSIL